MTDIKVHRYPKGRRPTFSEHSGMDEAMSMIMVLASEISVLRDRLDTFERVADENKVIDAASVESFEPDEATLAAREAGRQDFFERLFFVATKRAQEIASKDDEQRYQRTLDDIAAADE